MEAKKSETFTVALQKTPLNELQKIIFTKRFLSLLRSFEARCFRIAIFYHILRVLITVGSLIVPALLSIQYSDTTTTTNLTDPESFAYEIYWATWVISLLVTTSNGVVTVFKIDKKYFYLHTAMEQLRSEGWQYLELSGRYSGFYTPGVKPTHDNQFIYFCHAVEKIKMHQVEEEYFKLTDSTTQAQIAQISDSKSEKKENTLVHPTPQASLEELTKSFPPELRRQLKTLIQVDGAIAPALPVPTDVQAASASQTTVLPQTPDAQVSQSQPT
jgi:hypothetical protein